MGKLYTRPSKGEKSKLMNPKKETIRFLLDYSKALRINEYRKMKFEVLLN